MMSEPLTSYALPIGSSPSTSTSFPRLNSNDVTMVTPPQTPQQMLSNRPKLCSSPKPINPSGPTTDGSLSGSLSLSSNEPSPIYGNSAGLGGLYSTLASSADGPFSSLYSGDPTKNSSGGKAFSQFGSPALSSKLTMQYSFNIDIRKSSL